MPEKSGSPSRLHTINDISEVIPDSIVLSSKERAWRGVEVIHNCYTYDKLTVPAYSNHVIAVHLGRPLTLVQKIDGRVYEACSTKGDVTIVPAGYPSEWRFVGGEEIEVLNLHLQPTFIREVAAGADVNLDRFEIVNTLSAGDLHIEHIGLSLLRELQSEGLGGHLYVESLANVLTVHLLRHYSVSGQTVRKFTGGLSQSQLRRSIEYIKDNFEQDLTLTQIAASVNISPYHFARGFKQSTGLAPHQYLTTQRMERAKMLLSVTRLPVAEVAQRVGFSNQSHFSAQFRRATGMTPKGYRDSL